MMIITHKPFESHKIEAEIVRKGDSIHYINPSEVISVCCNEEDLPKAYDILGRVPSIRKEMIFMGDNAKEIVANW